MLKKIDYSIYTKDNPYKWEGSYEELLNTSGNEKAPLERSNIPGYVYIKYICKDCGKEEIAQVKSLRVYHAKSLKGIKDPISDDLICQSCKTKRIYQRDYGVDNPNQLQEVKTNNKKTFYENHPNIIPYSEEPIELNMEWEDFCKISMQTRQKVKFICKDCGQEVIVTYGGLRYRKKFTLNSGFYCKACQLKHSTYELDENILNNLPVFEGTTFEDLKLFMRKNNLTKDYSIAILCPICHKKDNIRINNLLKRRESSLNLCSGCYMEESLNNLSIQGSEIEEEIYNFIQSFYKGKTERHNRYLLDPQEIDIYLPELKLGIEFNGDYWHNSKIKDKYYHQNKSLKCLNLGVRLFHIYEKEWYQSSDIFKNLIYKIINNQEPVNTENLINLPFDKGNYIYYLNNGYHIKEILEPQLKPGYKKNDVFDSGIIILEK